MIESFKLPTITPETLTGSIVSFNDEYGNLPLKSCTSLISGYQEGSGTPSPDNVRPLHAFSSATLTANGNTHLFTFGQSIYQGSIDWKRGVVVGTHVLKNWSNLTWVLRSAEVGRWRTVINDIKQVPSGSVLSSLISDKAETVTANAFNNRINTIYLQANLNNVELVTGDADNAPSSGQLAYELATPIEIPLGGINLLTQEGLNSIFADCGDTEVKRLKVN